MADWLPPFCQFLDISKVEGQANLDQLHCHVDDDIFFFENRDDLEKNVGQLEAQSHIFDKGATRHVVNGHCGFRLRSQGQHLRVKIQLALRNLEFCSLGERLEDGKRGYGRNIGDDLCEVEGKRFVLSASGADELGGKELED